MLPVLTRVLDALFDETTGSAASRQRVTLFVAPTGYGKTRTVAEWLGDDQSDTSVRWITCTPHSSRQLWASIVAELARAVSATATPPVSMDLNHETAHTLARDLKRSLTLIIDDYHLATSVENDVELAELSRASPQLDLVVIGRRVDALASPLVTSRTRVRIIDAHSLSFTPHERQQLVEAVGITPSDALNTALALTDGWPLAIRGALTLGADTAYLSSESPNTPHAHTAGNHFDPIANLRAFTQSYFQLASGQARTLILAASLIDAIKLRQVQTWLDISREAGQAVVNELLELGLLREVSTVDGTEFQCHQSMYGTLNAIATQTLTPAQRQTLRIGRAQTVKATAPFAAFEMYCRAEEYPAAENLLARYFTMFIDEGEACRKILSAIPERLPQPHPTFLAALLFFEIPKPSVSPVTITMLTARWMNQLRARVQLPDGTPAASDPIYLPLLVQAMVASRVRHDLNTSSALMRRIEAHLISAGVLFDESNDTAAKLVERPVDTASPLSAALPTYFREVAATALACRDFTRARRSLEQLLRHSEQRIAAPWHGFGHASTRKVTESQSGKRWLLAALSELAFTELTYGNMRRCAELVAEFDARALEFRDSAPGISWTGVEIARAHLSFELYRPSLFIEANTKLAPIKGKLERWPLHVMAETGILRNEQGPVRALAHIRAALSTGSYPQEHGAWHEYFIAFEATLCTTIGDLTQAESLLSTCREDTALTRIERARLALYSGDDVGALLITQPIGDPETTIRQRSDRSLISAVAAWNLNRTEDAFVAFAYSAEHITKYGIPSVLLGVPYKDLEALTHAAKKAGVFDLTQVVAAVPASARSVRYERLTEMERKTLAAIAKHRSAKETAESLHVTTGTVKKHLVAVYRKLGVSSRDDAILLAGRMGLLERF